VKVLTIIFVLTLTLGIGTIANAKVQNVKVSGDITTFGFYRDDYDFKSNSSSSGTDGAWYSTITRLQVKSDLTDKVGTLILLSNERDWNQESNSSTDIDIDLAYVTLKEMFYSPLTLTIGKQELVFGNAMVVGASGTNYTALTADDYSARAAFDAIRLTFDYTPWAIDILTAKIRDDDVDSIVANEDLYGINAFYGFNKFNTSTEGYVFVKNSNTQDEQKIYTIGTRAVINPIKNLSLTGELAFQTGDYSATRNQEAWALDLGSEYTWANSVYIPSFRLIYNYRSGEETGGLGDYEAWDPMYEDQVKGRIYDFLFAGANGGDSSNVHIINVGGSIQPVDSITLNFDYYHYILDEKFSAGSHPANSNYTVVVDDDAGDEIDFLVEYAYTEDVTFGLEANWFFPGDAFADVNDDSATQIVGSVSVAF